MQKDGQLQNLHTEVYLKCTKSILSLTNNNQLKNIKLISFTTAIKLLNKTKFNMKYIGPVIRKL